MNLRKSGYEIEVKGEDVSRLEEKMLESGLCNFVVPMWISREGDKVKINYECSGLTSMRELHLKRPKETFEIIEKALLSLNHSAGKTETVHGYDILQSAKQKRKNRICP